jgi:hypothetical protein
MAAPFAASFVSIGVSAATTANLANEFLTRVSSDLKGPLTIAIAGGSNI